MHQCTNARMQKSSVSLGLLAFLCVGTLVSSQTPPSFRTEANYIRVDVLPTKDNAPVMDLKLEDFEVLENGVAQKIDQFEHIVIQGNIPQDSRREPNSVAAGRQMAENPRARVFVIFLDVNHVSVDGSHRIRQPLINALNNLIGPDDVFAVMTPDMSAGAITFARRTTTLEGELSRHWNWGQRDQINLKDPEEQQYRECYPSTMPLTCPDGTTDDDRGVADEMIDRRRERQTLNALEDLVTYLRGVREERKAIITITDGWRLYRPNQALTRKLGCSIPTGPQVTVDPRTGRPTTKTVPGTQLASADPQICERDRMSLAMQDDDQFFRELLNVANRANASFYPIDPRGLAVFDEPIAKDTTGLPPPGSTTITPPSVDMARLRERNDSLRTLAENTDGLAMVNSNDLAGSFKKIVSDLSSYYLLGYYSNGKLDGKFHSITVRVKRPGVNVRARRGYLAATPATAASPSRTAMSPTPEASAETAAVSAAIAPLGGYTRDLPLRVQMAAGWKHDDPSSAAMWVVGELGPMTDQGPWAEGFDATATLMTAANVTVAAGRVSPARGAKTFRIALTASQPIGAGDYVLRVGARAAQASIPSLEVLRFAVPPSPGAIGALFVRRGPTTGNKEVPTADLRFRRSEQVRVEIPTIETDAGTARLLDRSGKPLAVPVVAAVRADPDGSRWMTGQVALAPLAPGDYVIELSSGSNRMLSAFRVVP
jgi:VWFA-related protein